MQSGICTLLECGHELFLPEIVKSCIDIFGYEQLQFVTNNDYGIMLTPEDELYNNPLIQR